MKVYLCGPINGRSDDDCRGWREEVKALLPDCLDPMDRDYRGREMEPGVDREIVLNDKADIEQCDVLLVYYDKPSVGTSMEIFFAHTLGKRILLVNKSVSPLSPWLTYHCGLTVRTLSEAIDLLLCASS